MWLLLLLASGLQALRVEDDPLTLQVGDWLPEDDNHTVRFAHALEPDYAMEAKLEAAVAAPAHNVSELLMDIGGGTGAGAGTGDLDMDKDQLRRMRYQDKVMIALLVLVYVVALLFAASLTYRHACNDSPVQYYADPRRSTAEIATSNEEDFLEAFNKPPIDVQLQVTGLRPVPMMLAHLVDNVVEWQGNWYCADFSFSLDLSSWLEPIYAQPELNEGGSPPYVAALSATDAAELRNFLETDTNDLAIVEINPEIVWPEWEELATNIKQKIRQGGFQGIICVRLSHSEVLTVYKNRAWANFLHARATKMLCALSVVFYFIHAAYVWLRKTGPTLRSRFRVNLPISEYWQLVGHKITAEGFDGF